MISNCPSVPFLSKGGKWGGVVRGLTIMSMFLAAGDNAFVRADHMPPRPLELMVMLEWACWMVRVKRGLMGLRSMWRTCSELGRPVSSAVSCCR